MKLKPFLLVLALVTFGTLALFGTSTVAGVLSVAQTWTALQTFSAQIATDLTAHTVAINENTAAIVGVGPGTAGEAFTSGGSSADPGFNDLWGAPDKIPAANCNNATAGAGWSLPTSAAPTAVCRTGTNVQTGVLQFGASMSAQFQDPIPGDWDSATDPYVRIYYTQSDSTASQTLAFTVQIGCSTSTDDPSFATAQSFSTTTTGSTANTPYTQSLQLNGTSMTSCGVNQVMNVKINSTSSVSSSHPGNVQYVTITWPHLNPGTAQAN